MANEQSIFYQLGAAVKAQIASANGASTAVQEELNTTQAGAGLSETGAYVAETDSNYINAAATLKAADKLLDAQLKSANEAIDTKASQTDLNTTNSSLSTAESNITSLQSDKANLSGAAFTGDVSGTNLTLSGNLIVNGETTQTKITEQNLDIKDNFIGLNRGASVAANNAKDIGLYFERGSSESAGAIVFDETNDKFVVGFLEGGVVQLLDLYWGSGMDGLEATVVDTYLSLEIDDATKAVLNNVVEVLRVNDNWGNSNDYMGNAVTGDTISMVISSDGFSLYFTVGAGVNLLDLSSTTITLVHQDTISYPNPFPVSLSSISFEDANNPGSEYEHVSTSIGSGDLSTEPSATLSFSTSGSAATGSDAATASATAAPLKVGSLEIGATVLGDLTDFNAGLAG